MDMENIIQEVLKNKDTFTMWGRAEAARPTLNKKRNSLGEGFMIDMHSHIIPMVDDGSRSIDITKKMLESAVKVGFSTIFATPHYFDNNSVNRQEMLGHFKKVKSLANSLGIELLLGNEVYIQPDLPALVKDNTVSRMNESRYLLMEIPRNNDINYFEDVIFELSTMNIVPILAHPERYRIVREDPEILYDFADKGVLFQLNSGSLLGDYGDSVKKLATKLLKQNVYQFMGSDAHHYDRYKVYKEATEIVMKTVGNDVVKLLTDINPKKVKNNQSIESDLQPMKKRFLFWG